MLAAIDERFGDSTPGRFRLGPPQRERTPPHGASLSAIAVSIGTAKPIFETLDWHVRPGMQVAVTGPAGSGKTALLHAFAGITRTHTGAILWNGIDSSQFPHHQREAWRRRTLGCVFQNAGLFPTFDALHNVMLPATFGNWRATATQRSSAAALLERAGVRPQARVRELSRAERTRVAIVRALWARPRAVLADEPVARLDDRAAETTRRLLQQLCSEAGATLIVATRNRDLAETFENTYDIRARKLVRFVR
jgi:ABC-type lipoprotein export system ATPase subunit